MMLNTERPTLRPEHDPMMRLVNKYGSLDNIPDKELKEVGFVRVLNPDRSGNQVKKAEVMDECRESAENILSKYYGYLNARDYELLQAAKDGSVYVTQGWLNKIAARANGLQEAGIPPVHTTDQFGPSRGRKYVEIIQDKSGRQKEHHAYSKNFPILDFIVSYVAKQIGKKQAQLARQIEGGGGSARGKLNFYPPASAADFQCFRDAAFNDSGALHKALRGEVMSYLREKWNFEDEESEAATVERVEAALDHLEEKMRELEAKSEPQFASWDGDISIVEDPSWYLSVDPAEHESIARKYFESLGNEIPKNKKVAVRMYESYPDLAPDWLENLVHNDQVSAAIESGDYRGLPRKILQESEEARVGASEEFKRICQNMLSSADIRLLLPIEDFLAETLIPRFYVKQAEFLDELNKRRLEILPQISDDQFRERFTGTTGATNPSTFGKSTETDSGEEVRRAIYQRAQDLGMIQS